jgi:hypothetical protein
MIVLKKFKLHKGMRGSCWKNGEYRFCSRVIARLFGKLDKKATYEVRFYGKKPRTKVIKLYIKRDHVHTKVSLDRFAIYKGSGQRHTVSWFGTELIGK